MYYNDDTIIYLNGTWLKAKDASCSLYSQTLHYGIGVFEGMRAYNTSAGPGIFKAREHFERLVYSAKVMNIQLDYTVEEMIAGSYELLEKNGLTDAYVRPLVYMGPNMSLYTGTESNLMLSAWHWDRLMGDNLVHVLTSSFERPNPKACFVEAKVTGHYTNSIIASNEADQKGFDEALLLDHNGYVAEAPGANFFYEQDGIYYIPAPGEIYFQVLPGLQLWSWLKKRESPLKKSILLLTRCEEQILLSSRVLRQKWQERQHWIKFLSAISGKTH